MSPEPASVDLDRVLSELRERVAMRRAAGGYALDHEFADEDFEPLPSGAGAPSGTLTALRAAARVDANPTLARSNRRGVGPLVTRAKRSVALAVRQYVADVADQVTRFQLLAADTFVRQANDTAALEARVAAAEDAVRRLGGVVTPSPRSLPASWLRAVRGRTSAVVVDDGSDAASLRALGLEVTFVTSDPEAAETLRLGGFTVEDGPLGAFAGRVAPASLELVVSREVGEADVVPLRRALAPSGAVLSHQPVDVLEARGLVAEPLAEGAALGRFT